MRVISWNLLRLTGAAAKDVAALIESYHPDLLLMQEATEEVAALPTIVGGHCFREHLHGRIYGLAAWSRHPLTPPYALPLPVSAMPGKVPPRVAQIVYFGGVTFANVHLSHGQFLNRWQLTRIARTLEGPAAIVGDYNAVGPTRLAGFKDLGPRKPTHIASNIIPFRLDRCMARGLDCTDARVLRRGPSDHHPIILNLNFTSGRRQVTSSTFAFTANGAADPYPGAAVRGDDRTHLTVVQNGRNGARFCRSISRLGTAVRRQELPFAVGLI